MGHKTVYPKTLYKSKYCLFLGNFISQIELQKQFKDILNIQKKTNQKREQTNGPLGLEVGQGMEKNRE